MNIYEERAVAERIVNGLAEEEAFAKVPGIMVLGQWSAINNFMTELKQQMGILAEKHGVQIKDGDL